MFPDQICVVALGPVLMSSDASERLDISSFLIAVLRQPDTKHPSSLRELGVFRLGRRLHTLKTVEHWKGIGVHSLAPNGPTDYLEMVATQACQDRVLIALLKVDHMDG